MWPPFFEGGEVVGLGTGAPPGFTIASHPDPGCGEIKHEGQQNQPVFLPFIVHILLHINRLRSGFPKEKET